MRASTHGNLVTILWLWLSMNHPQLCQLLCHCWPRDPLCPEASCPGVGCEEGHRQRQVPKVSNSILIVDIVIKIHIVIKTSLCLKSTPPVVWQKLCCTEISVFPKGGRTANQLVWRDRSKNFGDAAADGSQCHVVQNKLPNLFAAIPFTASVQFRLQVQCFKILHPPTLWLGLIRISCTVF